MKKTLAIRWTKNGDSDPHQRLTEFSVEIPCSKVQCWVQDKIIALPNPNADVTHSVNYQVSLSDPVDGDQLDPENIVEALQQAWEEALATRMERNRKNEKSMVKWMEDLQPVLSKEPAAGDSIPWASEETKKRAYDNHPGLKNELNEWINRRDQVIKAKREADEKQAKERREKEKTERAKRDKDRQAYIEAWANKHGTDRLKTQLAQGYDGWPRYLHERIMVDFSFEQHATGELASYGLELYPGADRCDLVQNPSCDLLEKEIEVCKSLQGSKAFDADRCKDSISLRNVEFDPDEEDPYQDTETEPAVVVDGYRPGPSELFSTYTIVVHI